MVGDKYLNRLFHVEVLVSFAFLLFLLVLVLNFPKKHPNFSFSILGVKEVLPIDITKINEIFFFKKRKKKMVF